MSAWLPMLRCSLNGPNSILPLPSPKPRPRWPACIADCGRMGTWNFIPPCRSSSDSTSAGWRWWYRYTCCAAFSSSSLFPLDDGSSGYWLCLLQVWLERDWHRLCICGVLFVKRCGSRAACLQSPLRVLLPLHWWCCWVVNVGVGAGSGDVAPCQKYMTRSGEFTRWGSIWGTEGSSSRSFFFPTHSSGSSFAPSAILTSRLFSSISLILHK